MALETISLVGLKHEPRWVRSWLLNSIYLAVSITFRERKKYSQSTSYAGSRTTPFAFLSWQGLWTSVGKALRLAGPMDFLKEETSTDG